jgi:hypothetical protein
VARDLDNVREGDARASAPYAETVEFSDGLLARFAGKTNLRAFAPVKALLTKPRGTVTSMVRHCVALRVRVHAMRLAQRLTRPAGLAHASAWKAWTQPASAGRFQETARAGPSAWCVGLTLTRASYPLAHAFTGAEAARARWASRS